MATVHRIGQPENDSELKAIRTLSRTLPDNYYIFHNFELVTGRGLPYEYDLAIVGDYAVWHVEVKGYRGFIRGNQHQWQLENGGVQPSPIPLANKKTKILASKLRQGSSRLEDTWVDTCILLTDDNAKVRLKDEQASRVILLRQAPDYLTDPGRLPVATRPIEHLQNQICEKLFDMRPCQKVKRIGLYDVIERINQHDNRTVFLARHRYCRTRPKTILKVFHFDVYSSKEERERQIQAIFHYQDVMRLLGAHPNLIDTSDMFAWEDNQFVLPTEYIEDGFPVQDLLEHDVDKQVPWSRKAMFITKMCDGLRHAHERGVIHRDLRPMNVVAAPGIVKLVNFDLALIREAPELNDPKRVLERLDPRYTAPEVWSDPDSATEASDIYSLGIIFYQIITSEVPYRSIADVMKSGGETPLDRELLLRELSTPESEDFMESPEDAVSVISRMCRQDSAQRYQSVDEVIEDLAIIGD